MTVYHRPESCSRCRGTNQFIQPSYDSGHLHETQTKCTVCGFEDYWAYGFFESGSEIISKCETYTVGE